MAKYIHLFETAAEYETTRNNNYKEPWASYTLEDSGISFNKTEYEKLLEMPLTFEILSGGTIVWKFYGPESYFQKLAISYSVNDGEWTTITASTSGETINVNAGDIVKFKGDNPAYSNNNGPDCFNCFSGSTCKFNLKGNIMSLIDSDDYATTDTLTVACTFRDLFLRCTGLTNANKLIFPATTLTNSCYRNIFSGCTSLTTAPELPATTLANWCYVSMFLGCTSLTTAPVLPATTLADGCYLDMFVGCTSLTTAPALPATTLADSCYQQMFYGCSSLTTAPVLPATTLAYNCYGSMFRGCTNLNYIKCLATDISASNCTTEWVNGVQTTSGTFVKNGSMSSWTTGNNGIPSNWTVQDAS